MQPPKCLFFCLFLLSMANGVGQPYKLIAHRGGIVEGRYPENTPVAIEAAVDRGYWMLEVDVRASKDGKLVVHHDPTFYRFYGDNRKVADLTWEEIQQIRSESGNQRPIQFHELAALCKGKIRLMMDTKPPAHSLEFYEEMERVLVENGLLESAYFIGTAESREFFKGKARISIIYEGLVDAVAKGEPVAEHYFLFMHGNELTREQVRYAQARKVPVVPSVNLFHYREEDPMAGAYGDITWLMEAGVTEFQIDSEYDRWLLHRAPLTHGPFMGDLGPTHANIWARFNRPGTHTLQLQSPDGAIETYTRQATVAGDFCLTWELEGLNPHTTYTYSFDEEPNSYVFTTRPQVDSAVTLQFASCARDKTQVAYPVWTDMADQNPDALILLGDTPYIDTTHPHYQLRRYREFYEVPEFADLLRKTPLYSIWDDHDFGKNDTNGILEGKAYARFAFKTYRPNPSFGGDSSGIYTHFRMGPVEVFLLDTRWFAGTEPSPVKKGNPSLLCSAQWQWLQEELNASTAPFKVLACGMVWNGATRPNKPDHWGNYAYEREALFKFIGKKDISGVLLVGGDVHRSRHILHASASKAGYDIPEFITSPLHTGIIEAANAPHPGLQFDMGEGESFLQIQAKYKPETPSLEALFMHGKGKVAHRVRLLLEDLSR